MVVRTGSEVALFAGAGGLLLATQRLGFKAECLVEYDAACVRVLTKNMRNGALHPAPIWDDSVGSTHLLG